MDTEEEKKTGEKVEKQEKPAVSEPEPQGKKGEEDTNTVPYERFQEINEAKKKAEAETEKYRKQIEEQKRKEKEAQNKFQELYEDEKLKRENLEIDFQDKQIDNALKVEALKQGINDPNDIVLIDKSKITKSDTGDFVGIDETIKELKESKPYLFTEAKPEKKVEVEGGLASSVDYNTLTWEKLIADGNLAKKVKKENPQLYNRLKQTRGK